MFCIVWTNKARRQLIRILALKTRIHIYEKVDDLKNFPNCQNIKFLKNHKYDARLRIGNFRVFFKIENIIKVIRIEEVKKRDDQTY